MKTFDIDPVKGTLVNEPDKGEVTITCASLSGAWFRIEGEKHFRKSDEFDSDAVQGVAEQLKEPLRIEAMHGEPGRVRQSIPDHVLLKR